jgi:hypothetical protein
VLRRAVRSRESQFAPTMQELDDMTQPMVMRMVARRHTVKKLNVSENLGGKISRAISLVTKKSVRFGS